MKPLKALVIEDEKLARNRLKKLLEDHHDKIEIIGECDNGEDGYKMINELRPDLIFLDIQMPVMSGFEMLKKLTHNPRIIFTTAYEEYAIRAFEENSVDYLLKPIRKERLEITIKKLDTTPQAAVPSLPDADSIMKMMELLQPVKKIDAITVTAGDRMLLIKQENIVYFHSEEKYTFLYDKEDKRYILDHSLATLEKKLPGNFLRIHRSYIVNLDYTKEIRKGFNGKLIFEMQNNDRTRVTTGSSYTSQVKTQLKF